MTGYEFFQSLCNQFTFSIKVCSSVKHHKDWVECKSMDCYDIWIVTNGEIEIEMDDKSSLLTKGDVFFFYPQKLYLARSKSQSCTFIFIKFDIMLGKNIRPIDYFNFEGHTQGQDIVYETNMFIETFTSFKKYIPLSPLFLKGNLIMLFSKIALLRFKNNQAISDRINKKSSYIKLEKLISHIVVNINKNLAVKDLADYMSMSEKYFITFFKKHTGMTPYVYINNIRLRKAMEYLSGKKYSVKETAEMLGYSDQYTFSKAFKRYYGFPPSSVY